MKRHELVAESILDLDNVGYIRSGRVILENIAFRVCQGEHWVILGPNGAGKSSLLLIAAGYEWPSSGQVSLFGHRFGSEDTQTLRQGLAIFQPGLFSDFGSNHPAATAGEIIASGLRGSLAIYQPLSFEERDEAHHLLAEKLPLASLDAELPFGKMSTGERSKVLLLRMFARRPRFVILDEPYESLDIPSRYRLESLLETLVEREKPASLTVVHRVEEIPRFATHLAMLQSGRILRQGHMSTELTAENLSNLYGMDLQLITERGRHWVVPSER